VLTAMRHDTNSRAVDTAGAVAPRRSEPSGSNRGGGSSDSDPDSSGNDDHDGCSSKDEQAHSSTRKNMSSACWHTRKKTCFGPETNQLPAGGLVSSSSSVV